MTKTKELRDQSVEELQASAFELKKEIHELYNAKQQSKKLENPHSIRQNRRSIARILTVLKEKEQVEGSKV